MSIDVLAAICRMPADVAAPAAVLEIVRVLCTLVIGTSGVCSSIVSVSNFCLSLALASAFCISFDSMSEI